MKFPAFLVTIISLSFLMFNLFSPSWPRVDIKPSLSVSAQAQSNQTIQTAEFTGELVRIENNTMTIQGDSETRQYIVSGSTQITRDSLDAELGDIAAGDRVTVIYNQDTGEVLEVSAFAERWFDLGTIAIPAIILLVLILALVWYIRSKANKGKIKTTQTQINK